MSRQLLMPQYTEDDNKQLYLYVPIAPPSWYTERLLRSPSETNYESIQVIDNLDEKDSEHVIILEM